MRLSHRTLLPALLLLPPFAASPQAPDNGLIAASGVRIGLACPVSLDVRHGARGQAVPAFDTAYVPGAQVLDLTIHNASVHPITSIDAIVQTASGKLHLQPLSTQYTPRAEDAEAGERLELHIDRSIAARHDIDLDQDVASLNPILYVELQRVTYQDGSSWSAPRTDACRFVPDPMTLVSAR